MTKKLQGKVAVVTGASKGIGAGIAKALADEGASVVVNYSSSKQDADHVIEKIAARGGPAIAVQGDVSRQAHIERLFQRRRRRTAGSTSWSTTPGSTSSRRSRESPRISFTSTSTSMCSGSC
jgi:NAD(P)-dependent dehydrogenase (short-subunit alcohol dehydrogenase family)